MGFVFCDELLTSLRGRFCKSHVFAKSCVVVTVVVVPILKQLEDQESFLHLHSVEVFESFNVM